MHGALKEVTVSAAPYGRTVAAYVCAACQPGANTQDCSRQPTDPWDAQSFWKWEMRSKDRIRLRLEVQCYCTHLPEATQVHRAAVSRLLGLDIKSLVSPTAF
jgi:hypothetical protein